MARRLWFTLSIATLLMGCTNITVYKNPLSDLSSSVTRTRVAVDTITRQAHQVNTKNRALQAALESKRFGVNDLKDTIPPEYLKIRVQGLELIERLTARLLEVVDAKEGETAAKAVENVGVRSQDLAKQLGNTQVAHYAEPVSALAGEVIRIYGENKREKILADGVNQGIPEALKIVELLEQDFAPGSPANIQDTLMSALTLNVTEHIHQYDLLLQSQFNLSDADKQQPAALAQRLTAIDKIIAAQEAVNAMNGENVRQTLRDLSGSLTNLRKLVESNNDPTTLAVFVAQLQTFSDRSTRLLDATNKVRRADAAQ